MSCSSAYRLLDVGGTFIKCAGGGQVPVPSGGSREEIAAALQEAVGPADGLKGVGIAIPGPFDFRKGIFLMEHKFRSVYGIPFRELVSLPEQVELRFHHDVNALLRGAIRMLDLEKADSAVVTLGTGLGFAHALEGQVRYNEMGSPALNIWNIPIPGGGVLEDRISARGLLAAYARKTGEESPDVSAIADIARKGGQAALEVFSEMGTELGMYLRNILGELHIGTLLLGGQISRSMDLFAAPLGDALDGVRILPAPEGAVFEGLSSLFDNEQNL